MIKADELYTVLFLDIETVPEMEDYNTLDEKWQILWDKKAQRIGKYQETNEPELLYERAGIYAEFGKIVCISVGMLTEKSEHQTFKVKSFYGDDEQLLLKDFHDMMTKAYGNKIKYLCAHNGREFDFPYICRRLIINGFTLPKGLQIMGKKPWETQQLLDTMQMWAFGDFKSYTSLEVLAASFNIPSPKDDISGADVRRVYYEEKDVDRISKYCEKDVSTLFLLFASMIGQSEFAKKVTVIRG